MSWSRRKLLGSSVAFLSGCGSSLRHFPFHQGHPLSGSNGLQITYYSVGCFRLSWQNTAVLTDPFWSHLPFRQVAFGQTPSDPAQVDPYLSQLAQVQTVLVGHSHYDHVLDLPYVAPHLATDATLLGGQTLLHTLAPLALPLRMKAVNDGCANPQQNGQWLPLADGQIRVLPIASGHPNNYAFIHLWTDELTEDRSTPPIRASHFQEGRTFAFLVDFLDGPVIRHRVYIQTSSRGYPDGFFPQSILEEQPVDVALLAMDCANIEANGEDSIIDFLLPKTVIFCHWENFFRRKDQPPREIVKVNLTQLKRHFDADPRAQYIFPDWDTHYSFPQP